MWGCKWYLVDLYCCQCGKSSNTSILSTFELWDVCGCMVLFCHSVCLPVWLADWLAVCLSVCLRVCAAVYETKISRRINLSFKHYRATQRDCFSLPARVAKHTRLQTMTANASAPANKPTSSASVLRCFSVAWVLHARPDNIMGISGLRFCIVDCCEGNQTTSSASV